MEKTADFCKPTKRHLYAYHPRDKYGAVTPNTAKLYAQVYTAIPCIYVGVALLPFAYLRHTHTLRNIQVQKQS